MIEERPLGVPKYSWELSPSYTKLDLERVSTPNPEVDKTKSGAAAAAQPEPEPRPTGVPLYSWELWEMSSSYEESFRLARFNRSQGVQRSEQRSEQEETIPEQGEQVDQAETILGKRKDGEHIPEDDVGKETDVKVEVDIMSPAKKARMDEGISAEVKTRVELVEDQLLASPCSRRNNGRRTQRLAM